jgi:membrane protease YdiL (CAAX protease family)
MTYTVDTSKTPGWPETLVGLLGIVVVGIGGSLLLVQLPLSPMLIGLILTAMSGIGGLAGFLLAYSIRIRDPAAFGIRRTTMRWVLIALAAGCFAFLVKALAILLVMQVTGNTTNIQEVYATGGSGGWWSLILATLFLAVLTPIGEEFLFRGVITTALLRYGAVVGVAGGALIFALLHGVNLVFPAAVTTGLIAGEIFRRSGSIWPAVIIHAVVNLPTVPTMVALGVGQ